MKKIKLNILPICTLCVAIAFTSCKDSFLEVEPPTKATVDEYFSTKEHIEEALASVYVPVHMYDYNTHGGYGPLNFSDVLGDDFLVGASGPTDQEQWHRAHNFNLTTETTLHGYWAISYDGIKAANEAVKYAEANKETLPEAFYNRVKAEAQVMRCYYYSIVWKWFGNIPFFTETLGSMGSAPQLNHNDAYAGIIADLESAIALDALPMYQNEDNLGRVTKAMAYMLYTELVMYQNDNTRFDTALKYMTEIIKEPHYALNPDYANLWSPAGEWCSESIWEINYTDGAACVRSYDNVAGIGGTWLPQVIGPDGGVAIDSDVMTGGWGTFIPRRTAKENFEAGDKRIATTFLDCPPNNKARYQQQDLFLNKYAPRASHVAEGTGGADHCRFNDNFRVYRYSETLLNAAELIVRGASNTGGLNADNLLNEVRSRAGLGTATADINTIMTERRHEFLGEGKRYWDLVRMEGVSGATQKASLLLIPETTPVNSNGDPGRTGTWTPNKKYIPIKETEISAAQGGLNQNSEYLQ